VNVKTFRQGLMLSLSLVSNYVMAAERLLGTTTITCEDALDKGPSAYELEFYEGVLGEQRFHFNNGTPISGLEQVSRYLRALNDTQIFQVEGLRSATLARARISQYHLLSQHHQQYLPFEGFRDYAHSANLNARQIGYNRTLIEAERSIYTPRGEYTNVLNRLAMFLETDLGGTKLLITSNLNSNGVFITGPRIPPQIQINYGRFLHDPLDFLSTLYHECVHAIIYYLGKNNPSAGLDLYKGLIFYPGLAEGSRSLEEILAIASAAIFLPFYSGSENGFDLEIMIYQEPLKKRLTFLGKIREKLVNGEAKVTRHKGEKYFYKFEDSLLLPLPANVANLLKDQDFIIGKHPNTEEILYSGIEEESKNAINSYVVESVNSLICAIQEALKIFATSKESWARIHASTENLNLEEEVQKIYEQLNKIAGFNEITKIFDVNQAVMLLKGVKEL